MSLMTHLFSQFVRCLLHAFHSFILFSFSLTLWLSTLRKLFKFVTYVFFVSLLGNISASGMRVFLTLAWIPYVYKVNNSQLDHPLRLGPLEEKASADDLSKKTMNNYKAWISAR
jgi:hypothetical protein